MIRFIIGTIVSVIFPLAGLILSAIFFFAKDFVRLGLYLVSAIVGLIIGNSIFRM